MTDVNDGTGHGAIGPPGGLPRAMGLPPRNQNPGRHPAAAPLTLF